MKATTAGPNSGSARCPLARWAASSSSSSNPLTSGADGLAEDPLTNLQYRFEGYAAAARLLAKAFPDTPKLMGGAGGYLPDTGTPEVWAAVAGEISR